MPRKEYYQAHKEHIKSYTREYLRQRRKDGHRSPSDSKESLLKRRSKYLKNPENYAKNKARNSLNNAIRLGKMSRGTCSVQTCESVGEGHHPDYSKPLGVMWLCKLHHADRHRTENGTIND